MGDTKPLQHDADSAGLNESRVSAFAAGRSVRRWVYAALGVLSVGLAALGVFVPGLPTTVFLILGSYFFTRSCPWLEDRLIRNRFFGPYLRYLDGDEEMPQRARIVAMSVMWLAVSGSCLLLWMKGALSVWFLLSVLSAAIVGSIVIWRIRRNGSGARTERSLGAVDHNLAAPPPQCPAHHVVAGKTDAVEAAPLRRSLQEPSAPAGTNASDSTHPASRSSE